MNFSKIVWLFLGHYHLLIARVKLIGIETQYIFTSSQYPNNSRKDNWRFKKKNKPISKLYTYLGSGSNNF